MTKKELFDMKLLKTNFEVNGGVIYPSDFDEIEVFQNEYNVKIPQDLKDYYLMINGSGNLPLDNLYEFYSIKRTKRIQDELINWAGSPDYSKVNFEGIESVFVFGDFMFNLQAFGIELTQKVSAENKVFIFCGEDFKIIARSFTEFLDLYLSSIDEIYI